jgi:hypothetical protein
MLGPQAPGAEIELLGFSVNGNSHGMDVGQPIPVGATFGMADIMPELRRFATHITLHT